MAWFGLAVIVVLCLAIIVWWRVRRRKRAMRVLTMHNQRECDDAVAAAMQSLAWTDAAKLKSLPVADVWGHGIMAFEYVLPAAPITKDAFAAALKQQTPQVKAAALPPTLVITDWWTRDDQVHVDIAYVVNAATREYVDDLRRV
ncbi:hypothetical protein [Lacticaseibacillus jixiensis]|uniref:hypothetical protein n=1 Tax=Lacticaseibacillus jixiensis TaxID=3231926 RepID=UPI0036F21760